MSDILTCPENTQYAERQEAGHDWRSRLEIWLLALPAKYRHTMIRRELEQLATAPDKNVVSMDAIAREVRLNGLSRAALQAYFPFVTRLANGDPHKIEGALALIRSSAVQCCNPQTQGDMLAIAACAIALSGQAVHILTPDDDSTQGLWSSINGLLQHFNLHAGIILSSNTVLQRQIAYCSPVTLVCAREALRDYLDDRLRLHLRQQAGEISRKLSRLSGCNPLRFTRMRGLPFGIIVDANRVLIDQACTPMTIAGQTDPNQEREWAEISMTLARELTENLHFYCDDNAVIQLTDAGQFLLERLAGELPGAWCNKHRRTAAVTAALHALQMVPNQHYRVVDGRIELAATTRPTERLQQLLESREGFQVSSRPLARGKLTFQRFFRRYQQLAALCEDTQTIKGELWGIYGLSTYTLDPLQPSDMMDESMLNTADKKRIEAMTRLSTNLGRSFENTLKAYRKRQQRKRGEKLRRNLLFLDKQAGTVTAFSGRAE